MWRVRWYTAAAYFMVRGYCTGKRGSDWYDYVMRSLWPMAQRRRPALTQTQYQYKIEQWKQRLENGGR